MASRPIVSFAVLPTKITKEFAEYIKNLLYTSETLKQHNLEESKVNEAFANFLQHIPTPPIYTTILTNTLFTTRRDAISQLQQQICTKHKYPIEACHLVPECILIQSKLCNPLQIDCELRVHTVVEYRCGMAVLRGADVYTPGVLAISSEASSGDTVSVFCDIEGNCTRGMLSVNKSYSNLIFLGNGTLKVGREIFKVNAINKGVAIEMSEPLYMTPTFNNLMRDSIYLQNSPSMLVAQSLSPQSGDTLLDMCAAPGGKTIHCAIKMLDKGIILAIDNKQSRVNALQRTVDNFKVTSIRAIKFDSTKCCDLNKGFQDITLDSFPPFAPESFDKILLDAPCSGLGQRPQCCMPEVKSCSDYQKQFLSQAVRLLRVGGSLVYSTCSVNPLENESNAAWLLGKWKEIRLVDVGVPFGRPGLLGYGLDKDCVDKVRRFGPPIFNEIISNPIEDTIGFFIAKFTKIV